MSCRAYPAAQPYGIQVVGSPLKLGDCVLPCYNNQLDCGAYVPHLVTVMMRMVAMMAIMTTTMTMAMTMMTTTSWIMIYGTDLAHLILKPLSRLLSRGVHILLFPSPLVFFVEQRTRFRLFLSFHLPFSFSHARVRIKD